MAEVGASQSRTSGSRSHVAIVASALCVVALASAAVAGSATRLPGFHSPSGNIKCLFIPATRDTGYGRAPAALLCQIAHADYASKLQARCMGPSGGGVDWHGFLLTAAGKGGVNCSGGILYNPDTQRPSYVTLPYGRSWRQGVFTCSSRSTGVTCRNRAGHGVFVSRQTWRAW